MHSYRVVVHGENLLTEVDGMRQRLGFYTHVVVEGFTVDDAKSRAIDVGRQLERASCAPPSSSAVVAHLDRKPLVGMAQVS